MADAAVRPTGVFSWIELATTDLGASRAFYRTLFGWELRDDPIPDGGTYTMVLAHGQPIAGMFAVPRAAGEVAWLSHVRVGDVDAVAARVADLGGHVIAPPFNVDDAGRMARIIDPTGVPFALWQAGAHAGTEATGERPGEWCWQELRTVDVPRALRFYNALLGWEFKSDPSERYHEIVAGGRPIGGITTPAAVGASRRWLVYFTVDDCDATAETAGGAGAMVIEPPHDIPHVGRSATLRDPGGAELAVIRLSVP